jgi:ketosteroid isomerase-like protein
MMSFYTPDAVWDMSVLGMGMFHGRAATRKFLEDWLGAFVDWEQDIEEVRDLGNGVTLAVFLQRGKPAGASGVVQLRYAAVARWDGEFIQHQTNYTDLEQARAAAERLAEE